MSYEIETQHNDLGHTDRRLEELGITIPDVAAAVANYVPAVRTGNYVYTSGQLPFVDGKLPATGKVGVGTSKPDVTWAVAPLVDPEVAAGLARQSALNALAAVKALVGSLDKVVRIVKVVGFVASDPAFTAQPAVINGASNILGDIFGERGVHARSAVGVSVLPLDSPVEVELIVEVVPE